MNKVNYICLWNKEDQNIPFEIFKSVHHQFSNEILTEDKVKRIHIQFHHFDDAANIQLYVASENNQQPYIVVAPLKEDTVGFILENLCVISTHHFTNDGIRNTPKSQGTFIFDNDMDSKEMIHHLEFLSTETCIPIMDFQHPTVYDLPSFYSKKSERDSIRKHLNLPGSPKKKKTISHGRL